MFNLSTKLQSSKPILLANRCQKLFPQHTTFCKRAPVKILIAYGAASGQPSPGPARIQSRDRVSSFHLVKSRRPPQPGINLPTASSAAVPVRSPLTSHSTMNAAVLVCLLCLGGALASPAPYADSIYNEIGLEVRESQLVSIVDGARQLSLLLSELYGRGSETASALSHSVTPSSVARALKENDPVELALNSIELDTDACRQRLVCELQTGITGYTFGGMAYELIKSQVPALERYGYLSTRDLGVDSCRQAFPCQFSASPLMERARQLRNFATDFCDIDGDSYTSSACRAVTYAVDTLETL